MSAARPPAWFARLALCAVAAGGPALALPPDQIFERASPGVWALRALDADDKPLASASAVVVGPGKLVTSCQVLARARKIELRRAIAIYEATLEFPDVERDLCQLSVAGLNAPAPAPGAVRNLRPGQRVYVIGYTRGTEQSIADGLVSTVRDAGTADERVQTSVPAARGLLGAGLFDEEARLVGIVTSSAKDAPNAAFALPADWLAELASRGAAALARRSERAAPAAAGSAAAPGMPSVGTTWRYVLADRQYSRRQVDFAIRVLSSAGSQVEESIAVTGGTGEVIRRIVNATDARFLEQSLGSGFTMVEYAPYLLADASSQSAPALSSFNGYPTGGAAHLGWRISARERGWEQVTVPAGSFRAMRIDYVGQRLGTGGGITGLGASPASVAGRFVLSVWYAPEAGRYVRLEHRAWSVPGSEFGNDVIELLQYKRG